MKYIPPTMQCRPRISACAHFSRKLNTEPNRTKLNRSVGFFGSASVLDPGNFGLRLRCRFLSRMEPNNRRTEVSSNLRYAEPKLVAISAMQACFSVILRFNLEPTKAHNALLWADLRPFPVSLSCPTPSTSGLSLTQSPRLPSESSPSPTRLYNYLSEP